MAKRKKAAEPAAPADTPPDRPAEPAAESALPPDTSFDPAELETPPGAGPDQPAYDPVRLQQTINLTADNDGPKVRLFRNQRLAQVAVTFDEKPDAGIITLLRDAGFRWRVAERAWTKQLDPQARWKTQMDAEALVRDIGDRLRRANGLEPSLGVG